MISTLRPRPSAFSLIELMIAVVFITIAFFGYVALHSRILHSGQKLEEKEVVRAATDYYAGILISRVIRGGERAPDGSSFYPVPGIHNLFQISTSPKSSLAWLTENWQIPKAYHKGMDETMELSPTVLKHPFRYGWGER